MFRSKILFHWLSADLVCSAGISSSIRFGNSMRFTTKSAKRFRALSYARTCQRNGPFARLRPGSVLGEEAHVGNFVEIKNASLGFGSKAGHLSYLGDSEIGADVNIGAGTITCNYDGANKHKTIIEDHVFVGSDTQLVAPVTVRKGATIGAGTTVTREVGENELVITRVPQRHVANWQRPVKNKK